ncbi:hypothetical protein GTO87_01275 [Ligilactobacillus saerimneri]|uniref:Lipoprotein n=1 Tax=Ligilactobacillus saerimneri TaxID=228229 RepID=A0A7H9EJQ5_9LACO|nr:hypothetical protein [Ligilactobacillus saerimneri]QLL77375.1 hypothetical protein GTO87_01275 [Ligilactobacillus saerimneri]
MLKKKKVATGIVALLTVFSLGACSASGGTKNDANVNTQSQSYVNNRYQKALKYLADGSTSKANDELQKINVTSKTSTKVVQLRNNVRTLVGVEQALDANEVTRAEKLLDKLQDVSRPEELLTQIKAVKKESKEVTLANTYHKEIQRYYKAEKYEAAGGSLQALNSLNDKYVTVARLQKQASKYKDKIEDKQEKEAARQASYANARSSKIVSSQYAQQTGRSIESASNAEVASASSQVAQPTSAGIIQQFRAATGIPQVNGDQYFVQQLTATTYQIEIRHTSTGASTISNLKGLYTYDSNTHKAQKMDEITGEYKPIN